MSLAQWSGKTFAQMEGERLAHKLHDCKTGAELDAFVVEMREHPLVRDMAGYMGDIRERRQQIVRAQQIIRVRKATG